MAVKATKAIAAFRVTSVAAWISQGWTFGKIRGQAEKDGWGIAPRTLMLYQSRALSLLEREAFESRNNHLARHISIRRRLVELALEQGDIRAALAVLEDEAKLLGLYPSSKVEHTGKDGGPILSVDVGALLASYREVFEALAKEKAQTLELAHPRESLTTCADSDGQGTAHLAPSSPGDPREGEQTGAEST